MIGRLSTTCDEGRGGERSEVGSVILLSLVGLLALFVELGDLFRQL
jgi:hypothetical protein